MIQVRVVRHASAETDVSVGIFLEVTDNSFKAFEVASTWCVAKSPHGHGSTMNVVTDESDRPLEGANKALIISDLIGRQFIGEIEFGMVVFVNWWGWSSLSIGEVYSLGSFLKMASY
jgi:hypothetical protein